MYARSDKALIQSNPVTIESRWKIPPFPARLDLSPKAAPNIMNHATIEMLEPTEKVAHQYRRLLSEDTAYSMPARGTPTKIGIAKRLCNVPDRDSAGV